jgi:hypothetical protein
MLENMAGAVGFAMHAERLARAAHNLRLQEAEAATGQQRRGSAGGSHRAAVATLLIALAARIAPTVARPSTGIPALGQ